MPETPEALPPKHFGRAMLSHWPLDRDATYLNHGTVGVTPWAVMRARQALLDEIERQPARTVLREMTRWIRTGAAGQARLQQAAAAVAAFLKAPDGGGGLVYTDNATAAVNAVLRSFDWRAGDEILLPDHAYGGVLRAARFIAREHGVVVRTVAWPFPVRDAQAYVDALDQAITPRTRLAIVDQVTSETALVLPLAQLAAVCRARGVAVLADGAHAPGAIDVDLGALGVDWYAANLHKWAFAPRSCGVLWAAPDRRAGLHPPVASWGAGEDDWLREFEWPGTRDFTPWLAAPAGLEFMTGFLGLEAMRTYNHGLAWQGAQALAARWGHAWVTPETMTGCMATVPLPARLGPADAATAARLRDALLFEHGIEVPVIARGDALWVRLAIQVYNDESDLDRLADAVDAISPPRR